MAEKKKKRVGRIIVICIIIFLVVTLIIAYIVTHTLIGKNFARADYPEFTRYRRYDDFSDSYDRQPCNFMSGENRLQAYIYGGENDKGLIVLAHGIGGGHANYFEEITRFVDEGWRVFAYDATGVGESEGDGTLGLPQSAVDLDCALTYIESDPQLSALKKVVFGYSWGGYAAGAILNYDHDLAASVSVSGYNKPIEMMVEFADGMMGGKGKLIYPFIWLDMRMSFGKRMDMTAIDGINKTDIPVLILHGTGDQTVGFDRSSIISERDSITNPNVEYYISDNPKKNGHNSIFFSEEATDLFDEFNAGLDKLEEEYNGDIPHDVQKAYYDSRDKVKINEINEEMISVVLEFMDRAVK